MTRQIETSITQVDPQSRMNRILPDGRGTTCNGWYECCGQFRYATHKVPRDGSGRVIPEQVRIGLCLLTGVACLRLVEIVVSEILPSEEFCK